MDDADSGFLSSMSSSSKCEDTPLALAASFLMWSLHQFVGSCADGGRDVTTEGCFCCLGSYASFFINKCNICNELFKRKTVFLAL